MIKQVFMPLVVLGQGQGDLLEFYVEPRWLKLASCFSQLGGTGLDNSIAIAQQALTQLQIKTGNGVIHINNPRPLLSNALGTAAGLVLASIVSLKACPYSAIIVSTALEHTATDVYVLTYNGFWIEKLAAILTLPKQTMRTPLILAADTPLVTSHTEQLIARNIYPVLMDNLQQAVYFCLNSNSWLNAPQTQF
jgi:hypothetical protein